MTREQMIAWFTIEGWAPVRGKHEAYLRGVMKDGQFVCLNAFFAASVNNPARYMLLTDIRDPAEWEEIPTEHMAAMIEKIERLPK